MTAGSNDAPLRNNIRQLGRLLGEVLREQGGDELFWTVESIRTLSKDARAGQASARSALEQRLAELDDALIMPVARAFSHFLNLANIAEQHHRIRRSREYRRATDSKPQRGSLDAAFPELVKKIYPERLYEAVCNLRIGLVLTAHPTEVMRRTLLQKHYRIAKLLDQQDRPDLAPDEIEEIEEALKREITAAWFTDEIRPRRPTPVDEARWGFAVVEHVLWDAIPRYTRRLDKMLQQHTGYS